jgi:uncharacterized membrane protein YozB (DUF420 family)
MRRRNWRIVIVGVGLLVLSAAFFLGVSTLVPKSNDPVTLLRTIGEVSGVVGALSLVMILFGLIGRTSKRGELSLHRAACRTASLKLDAAVRDRSEGEPERRHQACGMYIATQHA